MFSLLAAFVILLSFGGIPILIAAVFLETSPDDLARQRELLATSIEVEKSQRAWRARHQTLDCEP